MPQWRKLHTKITESLDVNDMPDDFTRLLWVLLPTQLCSQGRGVDNPSWVRSRVFPLREDVTLKMVTAALDWLWQRGMIVRYQVDDRGYFFVPTFTRYQGNTTKEAKSEYPEPPELVQTYSGPTPELVQRNSASDSDSDSDVDSDSDAEVDAIPQPESAPEAPPRRPDRRSDPRSRCPAIVAARGATGGRKYPPIELYDGLIHALGDTPDTEKLQQCRQTWVERGYNPGAWTWATEWYVKGIPAHGPRGSPRNNGQDYFNDPSVYIAAGKEWNGE